MMQTAFSAYLSRFFSSAYYYITCTPDSALNRSTCRSNCTTCWMSCNSILMAVCTRVRLEECLAIQLVGRNLTIYLRLSSAGAQLQQRLTLQGHLGTWDRCSKSCIGCNGYRRFQMPVLCKIQNCKRRGRATCPQPANVILS